MIDMLEVRAVIGPKSIDSGAPKPVTAREFAELLAALASENEALIEVRAKFQSGELQVGVSGDKVFLVIDVPVPSEDGPVHRLLQYVTNQEPGSVIVRIGGVDTPLDSKYIMDVPTAISVVLNWALGTPIEGEGWWELQWPERPNRGTGALSSPADRSCELVARHDNRQLGTVATSDVKPCEGRS